MLSRPLTFSPRIFSPLTFSPPTFSLPTFSLPTFSLPIFSLMISTCVAPIAAQSAPARYPYYSSSAWTPENGFVPP
jgi:hypothetical protein